MGLILNLRVTSVTVVGGTLHSEKTLFTNTEQHNIQIIENKNIFFKYRTKQIKNTETNK